MGGAEPARLGVLGITSSDRQALGPFGKSILRTHKNVPIPAHSGPLRIAALIRIRWMMD